MADLNLSHHSGDHAGVENLLRYDMDCKRRGLAVIFNNHIYDNHMKPRAGSHHDVENLTGCLRSFGFSVETHHDLSVEAMREKVREFGAMDHSTASCFFVAIFSHGNHGGIVDRRGKSVSTTELMEDLVGGSTPTMACTTLAGKPKLFVIQACRGSLEDHGVVVNEETMDHDAPTTPPALHRIASRADFLFAFATAAGTAAWRKASQGSWFIWTLCEIWKKYAKDVEMDFVRILTEIASRVANDNVTGPNGEKQAPAIESTLTKLLFIKPMKNPDENENGATVA